MDHLDTTLGLLDRLVGFETVSPESNLDLIDWAETHLRAAGFDVQRIWSKDRRKAGLFARIGPDTDGGVCLSAHSDVVPVEGQDWRRPAFKLTREGNRVFGRGTTDMKGFLASMLALAEKASAVELSAPLSFVISFDEEVGCLGIRQMMPALAPLIGTPRAVFVGEPTSMNVATGHKGKSVLKVTCTGQAGHSALAPHFLNAIHLAADFTLEMRALQTRLTKGPRDEDYSIPYSTVHLGRIEGGRALNIVPDHTHIDMEFRHLPGHAQRDIRAEIEAAAMRIGDAVGHRTAVGVKEINSYPGLETAPDDPAVSWACSVAGGTSKTKVPFGTEAGFFAELGLCTVVVGPGNMAKDGHQPDEGLDLVELAACDAMLGRVLSSLTA